jgi:hypothetical protein
MMTRNHDKRERERERVPGSVNWSVSCNSRIMPMSGLMPTPPVDRQFIKRKGRERPRTEHHPLTSEPCDKVPATNRIFLCFAVASGITNSPPTRIWISSPEKEDGMVPRRVRLSMRAVHAGTGVAVVGHCSRYLAGRGCASTSPADARSTSRPVRSRPPSRTASCPSISNTHPPPAHE